MNPHLDRARMLISQSRHELAEQELRQALTHDPNSAEVHACLAICLCERKSYQDARQEAEHAVHLAPDEPFTYYVRAMVLYQCNRFAESRQAIAEALALDSYDADYFALLSQICFAQRRWQEALESADEGLQLDPENDDCANLRAMALVKLGKKEDAGEAILSALKRDPDNAITHANHGWTLVEQGQYEKAMEHFREALRINPEMEWARQGILEAMKARYFIYRIILGFFLWMAKLTQKSQWMVLIGAYIGFRLLVGFMSENPQWAPWIMPVVVAYVAFALMTWLAVPLFNLVLRLNRFGRLALSREQIVTANWVGLLVLGAIVCVVIYFTSGVDGALLGALACAFVIPPLSQIYNCSPGGPRTWCIVITVAIAAIGFFASVPFMAFPYISNWPKPLLAIFLLPAVPSLRIFPFAAIGAQLAVNALVMSQPRR